MSRIIIAVLGLVGVLYALWSFVFLTANPARWPQGGREFLAFAFVFLATIAAFVATIGAPHDQ